jgi:hypothetical protein
MKRNSTYFMLDLFDTIRATIVFILFSIVGVTYGVISIVVFLFGAFLLFILFATVIRLLFRLW